MTTIPAASDAQLLERFSGVFERIAAGAVEREQKRELARDAVQWLKASGFTALRVPREYGGGGATLPQFFRLLTRLGEADSNLPQILRLNFGFIEMRLESDDEAARERWLSRIAAGETVGAAISERTGSTHNTVTITPDGASGQWLLNGEKYYSTGALYADWINVTAHDGRDDVHLLVRGDAPGVARLDDWDGFGQRLTASGTTRFDNVRVEGGQILHRFKASEPRRNTIVTAYYQTVHLATLAGIARAVLRDGVAFVQGRTRTFGVPGRSSPRDNPLVHRVVGRLASLAFAAESVVDAVSAALENVHRARAEGRATADDYIALDIQVYKAQQIVIEQVLEASTLLFEVGGASATSEARRLDRHWRNARVIASHNPAIQREAAVGDFHLNGTAPNERFSLAHAKDETANLRDDAGERIALAESGR
ncbi:acyl-CoA dehydrogenase [Caballeronia arationis]|jgi:alkylation response protein AidB-like acyl-CoA dehydrogenase|uniref:Dibenzothiophene monooxygenase n=1 Tax=Caballeronia arationis TaxID=1777142 RepID=A0A7Z7IAK0_9BURK|nr:acyl-CoA dehydrogenase family protein [Caballeronia arationis]SAL02836.1 acyl-CoA dehydrogenase [Caballeronia arationis]SOE81680.1 Acyl-CoA dehydrogenase [Caballeronia arationis]